MFSVRNFSAIWQNRKETKKLHYPCSSSHHLCITQWIYNVIVEFGYTIFIRSMISFAMHLIYYFMSTHNTNLEASKFTLLWRHNGHDGVSSHQPHGCLPNRLFGRRSKKTSKLRFNGLCAGNSGTGEFPAQMASNVENVSIWWRSSWWAEAPDLINCEFAWTDGVSHSTRCKYILILSKLFIQMTIS